MKARLRFLDNFNRGKLIGGVSLRSRGVDFVHWGVSHFVFEGRGVIDTLGRRRDCGRRGLGSFR